MSKWRKTRLGKVVVKISSGATPKGGSNAYKESGISLIRSQNILDFQFVINGLVFIDEEQAYRLRNVTVKENDILLNITGDSVARCCVVPCNILPARVNQHVAIIRLDSNQSDYAFIFYLLQAMKEELLMQSEIGATRKALTKGMIENLAITLPPLPEQKAIAAVLSSLDDKIDLLHRQNKTLEALAEILFRQWFVEEAREDWEVGTLGDILTMKGGATPSTKKTEYWNGDIHWTTPRDLSNNNHIYLLDTARKISSQGLQKISSGLLPKGVLLLSSRAPVGYLAFSEVPIAINQGYIAIIDDKGFSKNFIYLWLKINIDYVKSFANGSTFQEISKTSFKTLEITIPPETLRLQFDENITPIFEKIKTNVYQIQTLSKLRDTLLPKLMSGEVRVKSI